MFELFLVLFLVSGMLKSFGLYLGLPAALDFIILFGILLLLSSFFRLYKSPNYLKLEKSNTAIIGFLLFFSFWMIVATIYSPSTSYKWQKLIGYFTSVVSFTIVVTTPLNVIRFSKLFLFSILSITAVFLFLFMSLRSSGITNEHISSQYLMVGTYVGIAGLMAYYLRDSLFKKHKYLGLISLAASFVIALVLGGRGPVIFILATLLVSMLYKLFTRNIKIRALRLSPLKTAFSFSFVSMLFVVVSAFIYKNLSAFSDLLDRSIYRFSLLLESGNNVADNNSVETRVSYIGFSIDSWLDNWQSFLFGEGFGSFGLIYSGVDQRLYPHNLFLEVSTETGAIGMILLFLFLTSTVFRIGLSQAALFPIWPSFYYFLNLMKSSSLADTRVFFVLFALAILVPRVSLELKENSKRKEYKD